MISEAERVQIWEKLEKLTVHFLNLQELMSKLQNHHLKLMDRVDKLEAKYEPETRPVETPQ